MMMMSATLKRHPTTVKYSHYNILYSIMLKTKITVAY